MTETWPIRPMPKECEPIASWVRRIAEDYCMDYNSFCRDVLFMNGKQLRNLNIEIPEPALSILSMGSGIPKDRIRNMTLLRIMQSIDNMVEHYQHGDPEGSRKLSRSMREDKYAIVPRRPRTKHRASSDETMLTRSRRPGSAWIWTYTYTDDA